MNNKYKLVIVMALGVATLATLGINNYNNNIYNKKIYIYGDQGKAFGERLYKEVPNEDIDKLKYAIKKYGNSWKEGEVTIKEALALVEDEPKNKDKVTKELSAGERTEKAIIDNPIQLKPNGCSMGMKHAGWC